MRTNQTFWNWIFRISGISRRRYEKGYVEKIYDAGYVLATDISGQMLGIAKERAASLGLQRIIEFKQSDAENLDLPT